MSDVTVVCVKCGKEKIFPSFLYAESKGWTMGLEEYCKNCKPEPELPQPPSKPAVWYQFYWYLSLLRGGRDENLVLDRIRRADTCFMTYWDQQQRTGTWVEDTLYHWHVFPSDFTWKRYHSERQLWLKYNASLEQRARNYQYVVWTFKEHKHLLEYWTGRFLEIV